MTSLTGSTPRAPAQLAVDGQHRGGLGLARGTLVLALAGWLALVGWALAGGPAALAGAGVGLALAAFSPWLGPAIVLTLYRTEPLDRARAPAAVPLLQALARHARRPAAPRLHYLPSQAPILFTTGRRHTATIVVSDGLLRRLSQAELAGALAHELAHLARGDLPVLVLADLASRTAAALAPLGLLGLAIGAVMQLQGQGPVSWAAPALLAAGPLWMGLVQLALIRPERELAADRLAVRTTGDVESISHAVRKLELDPPGVLHHLSLGRLRPAGPSLLRAHPAPERRLRRLHALAGRLQPDPDLPPNQPLTLPTQRPAITARPRWHLSGLWY